MKKYLVYVETTVLKCFEVEANSADEAVHLFAKGSGEYVTEISPNFNDGEITDVVEEE